MKKIEFIFPTVGVPLGSNQCVETIDLVEVSHFLVKKNSFSEGVNSSSFGVEV